MQISHIMELKKKKEKKTWLFSLKKKVAWSEETVKYSWKKKTGTYYTNTWYIPIKGISDLR